tara:strand:- start:974 stop:1276 length:303 start_codon:yes stop_codon:yes gene_type:complete
MTKYRTANKIIDMLQFTIDCRGKTERVIPVELIDEICKKYHKEQLKNLSKHIVSEIESKIETINSNNKKNIESSDKCRYMMIGYDLGKKVFEKWVRKSSR